MVAFSPQTPPDALSQQFEDQLLEAIITGSIPAPSSTTSGPDPAPDHDHDLRPSSSSPHPSSPHSSSSPPPLPASPTNLAHHFNLSLRLVLDFLSQPSTRARIAAAVEAAQLAEYHRTQRARAKALDALETILDTTEDPVEKRRAASAILRPSRILPLLSALSAQRPPAPHPSADPIRLRAAPPHPSPHLTPQQVVWHILSRLDDNHNPTSDAGLTTLWNFFHRAYNGGIDRPKDLGAYTRSPGRDAELTQFKTFALHAPLQTPDPLKQAAQPATIIHDDGTSKTILFRLVLITDPENKVRREWRISDIQFDFSPPDPGQSGSDISHAEYLRSQAAENVLLRERRGTHDRPRSLPILSNNGSKPPTNPSTDSS